MFDPVTYDDGSVDYPYCDVCGRVLHDGEDLLPDKDSDGKSHWCSVEHSPEFMAGILAYAEYEAVEANQMAEANAAGLQQLIRDTVATELARLREAGKL